MLRSVLVALDLGPTTPLVLERALRLPLVEDARVTLLHALPVLLVGPARARAEADAHALLGEHASRLASRLPEAAVIGPVLATGPAATAIGKQASVEGAELVLLGRGGPRTVRDVVLGATAERVLRRATLPVLVVRRSADEVYRRPLLALDVDQPAEDLLAPLLALLPTSAPDIAWVHAYEAPFEGFVYPSFTPDEVRGYRDHYRAKAHGEVAAHLAAAVRALGLSPGLAPGALSLRGWVVHGPPREVVKDEVARAGADLLVLGTHAYGGAARAFLGTVAGDLLREVPCDALVVPARERQGGADAG